jgi:hypothetical protein
MEANWRVRARAVYLMVIAAMVSGARVAWADDAPVVVGEVATRVSRPHVDLPKALRRALEREVAALGLRTAGGSKRYVLSASLVKLEGGSSPVRCTVSAVLRERKSGAIRAIVEGRAESDERGESAELDALDAATRGAVASLPNALR